MSDAPSPAGPTVLQVADAVGALMEAWGFKRNMGRMWTALYLADHPLTASELGDLLGLSSGSVSMLLAELGQWGAVKKAWIPGERREHYQAETTIWKLVSRVLRERELNWVKTALESFEDANRTLDAIADVDPQVRARVAGLADLARVGAHLLEAILQGESVDALPLKSFGALR